MSGPIVIRDLYKKYSDNYALNGLNLTIDTGQIYGILGPNGSGKTTLLRILCSLLEMTSGYVRLGEFNPVEDSEKVKSMVGYVPETPALYESLTPLEYFSFVCSVRGIREDVMERRVRNLVEAFGISDKVDDFIGSLSFGTKQKVAIISAIIHDPDYLILDEGMNGLDPRSAKILKDLLQDFASHGKTVIFSTHILEVAESVCNRISILFNGKIVIEGTMEDMRLEMGQKQSNLEDIFLKLTGDEDLKPVIETLKRTLR